MPVGPGSYIVGPQGKPAGMTPTTRTQVGPVTVVAGEYYLDADFGYNENGTNVLGTIGNLVFRDANKDGTVNIFDVNVISANWSAAGGAAAAVPDVMTLAEAAAYMRVSQQDLQQLIASGQVKAKQIGSEYRISKKALDAVLAE